MALIEDNGLRIEWPDMSAGDGPGPAAAPRRRVLVVKLSSLGDLFHALPAVHALKTGLDAEVHWVTQPAYADLVPCFADVSRVIVFDRQGFPAGFRRFVRELRRDSYDCVVDLQGLLKSALVTRLARGRERIGPSFHREGAALFYSRVAGTRRKDRHAVEENLDVARALGLECGAPVFPVRFGACSVVAPRPRIAVMPVSRWASKNWPADAFVRALRRVRDALPSATFFLLGGRADAAVCVAIAAATGGSTANLTGRTTLVQMGSLLGQMDLVLSNDSGPMHMAAATGVPVLALFGPTDPKRTGPFGPGHRVLTAGELECRPCFCARCRFGATRCMEGLAPEAVAEAMLAMLGAKNTPKHCGGEG